MSTPAWKDPNAHHPEPLEELIKSAFSIDSPHYNRHGPKAHNPMVEYLGSQTTDTKHLFKPKGHVLAFDLETTGIEDDAEIIQFYGELRDSNLEKVDSGFEVIGNPPPGHVWSPKARVMAGEAKLTDDVLSSRGVDRETLKKNVLEYLEGIHAKYGKVQALGSNIRFDINKLVGLIGKENVEKYFDDHVLDTMSISAYAAGREGNPYTSHALEQTAERAGVKNKLAHNAASDTPVSVEVFKKFLQSLEQDVPLAPKIADAADNQIVSAIKPASKMGAGKLIALTAGALLVGSAISRSNTDPEPAVPPKGIRQSYPTNPGQFEAMKPHAEYGFPGGREQLFKVFSFLGKDSRNIKAISELGLRDLYRGSQTITPLRAKRLVSELEPKLHKVGFKTAEERAVWQRNLAAVRGISEQRDSGGLAYYLKEPNIKVASLKSGPKDSHWYDNKSVLVHENLEQVYGSRPDHRFVSSHFSAGVVISQASFDINRGGLARKRFSNYLALQKKANTAQMEQIEKWMLEFKPGGRDLKRRTRIYSKVLDKLETLAKEGTTDIEGRVFLPKNIGKSATKNHFIKPEDLSTPAPSEISPLVNTPIKHGYRNQRRTMVGFEPTVRHDNHPVKSRRNHA